MRIVPINFCVAKIQPQYWQAIKRGKKTVEIRDERVDADYFIFLNADDKYQLLGEAIITGEYAINTGSTGTIAGAGATMSELEHIYPHAIQNGVTTQALYAYHIQPVKLGGIVYDVLEKIM